MGVAGHLGIELGEYDQKIRTFVPHYETLLAETARALTLVGSTKPTIVDLGIGTGALTEACLAVRPAADVIGVDADPGILDAARYRLREHANVEFRNGNFVEEALPPADAMVACIALHHIASPEAKQAFYHRAHEALRPGGLLASGDCFPAVEQRLASQHHQAWLQHLERTYRNAEAEGYLEAWAGEDTYFPLELEMDWLRAAGFAAEVLWRSDGFAVVVGMR